jgi:hypothetical protein
MVEFTTAMGQVVEVPDSEVMIEESNGDYEVVSATHNPTGEKLTTVRYNPLYTQEEDSNPLADETLIGLGDGMGYDMNETMLNQDNEDNDDFLDANEESGPITRNPPASKMIDWRNLRLQSAIDQEGVLSKGRKFKDRIARLADLNLGFRIGVDKSIRGTNLLSIVTAQDWYEYMKNLGKSTVDRGAESAYEPSPAQKFAVALFLDEWDKDPGHNQLRGRINTMNAEDANDVIAKGQIINDVMRKPQLVLGKFSSNNRLSGLAYDILTSMPISTYNYYTMFQLHPDEGDDVYQEFRSRYIPLGTNEVEMVNEIMHYLNTEGDGYAFRTTMNETTALQAAQLMKTAVRSYEIGDTVTTRSAIGTLTSSPFNYKPLSMKQTAHSKGGTDKLGESKFTNLTFVALNVPDSKKRDELVTSGDAKKLSNKIIGMYALGLDNRTVRDGGNMDNNNQQTIAAGDKTQEVRLTSGADNFTAKYLAIRTKHNGKDWRIVELDETMFRDGKKSKQGKRKKDLARTLGMKKNPRKNPKGRGKFLSVEIWPKSQLTMPRRDKKTQSGKGVISGETRHGLSSHKTGYAKWTMGLDQFFKKADGNKWQMLQMGILKKTGEEAPYRIRLPISHFKTVSNHSEAGYKTIVPFKGSPQMKAAYAKLVKQYGWPKHAPSKDTYMRFIIPNKAKLKSPYYKSVRKKAGAKKTR